MARVAPTPRQQQSEVVWSLGITPVQQWISAARRSRDLLAGSAMLSWLMSRLLWRLLEEKATMELPALDEGDLKPYLRELSEVVARTTYGIPNRASGRMSGTPESAAEVFRNLERELVAGWESARQEVATNARRSAREVWDLVGRYAVEAPCPFQLTWCVQDSAWSDLAEIDRLYAAVKRARFVPVHQGAPVPKCSQCGRCEAVGGAAPGSWKELQAQLAALEEVERGLRLEARERLCPVCLLKRFAGYMRSTRFPSTSTIAARAWKRGVLQGGLGNPLAALEDAIREVPSYGEPWADPAPLYYRRTLEAELRRARRRGDDTSAAALGTVAERQATLRRSIAERRLEGAGDLLATRPPEYLAVLGFDGDDMGRRMRARMDVLPTLVRGFQEGLAARLSGGSGADTPDALALVEPFYLGGDEGLLLAPAAVVLDVATGIRELWRAVLEKAGEEGPTLSVGVALFDRERPLGPAIETAHAALARAKELTWPGGKKDALAVTVVTASGSRWTAFERWGAGWDRARSAVGLIRTGLLAAGWPHDVERFLRSLDVEEALAVGEDARSAIREEVKRLTLRRTAREEKTKGREATSREDPWDVLDGEGWWQGQPSAEERKAVSDQLHLVAFLARSTEGGRDVA